MIPRRARARAGITLTEILISIMIMGVGLVSVATLFPLGLIRLRDAARNTRSALLSESVTDDLVARALLNRTRFTSPLTSSAYWYSGAYNTVPYDPWLTDPIAGANTGLNRDANSPGYTVNGTTTFPVAYDPLWRFATPQPSGTTVDFPPLSSNGFPSALEGRFGCGFVTAGTTPSGFIRNDPADNQSASAYGMPRITNFTDNYIPTTVTATLGLTYGGYSNTSTTNQIRYDGRLIGDVFASPDDVVLQEEGEPDANAPGVGNPLLPDLSNNFQMMNDWSYSWMITGKQVSPNDPALIEGNIVIFHNRAFGTTSTVSPFDGQSYEVPTGDRVLEAIFGYGRTISGGFAVGADRTVLVRWPASMPDPEIKVGNWIADVTYERIQVVSNARTILPNHPTQRCEWYRIVRRGDPEASSFSNDPATPGGFRQMILTTQTALRSRTPLTGAGEPFHVNVALFSPYVVNVFPKVFNTR